MAHATCSIEGCDSPTVGRGYCRKHYTRWQRHGDPLHLERVFIKSADGLCLVGGCDKPTVGQGLCRKHYQRNWKHGDPSINLRPEMEQTLEERFWAKVNKDGPIPGYCPHLGPCWLWEASCSLDGYGQIGVYGSLVRAHRFSYELMCEPIPDGLEIDHLCRVRACVNPAHLQPVTSQVNAHRGADARIIERGGKCAKGHDMTRDNIYWKANRRPMCRTCVLENQRRHQQRKKAGDRAA